MDLLNTLFPDVPLRTVITLLAYVIVFLPLMLIGGILARRKHFHSHKIIMTTVVVANWALISMTMIVSYQATLDFTARDFSNINLALPTVHLVVGAIAQLMATYLVLLMWSENTRLSWIVVYRIKGIKWPMRITLTLWIVAILLGFAVYGVFYGGVSIGADDTPLPITTEEAQVDDAPAPETTEAAQVDDAPAPETTEAAD